VRDFQDKEVGINSQEGNLGYKRTEVIRREKRGKGNRRKREGGGKEREGVRGKGVDTQEGTEKDGKAYN